MKLINWREIWKYELIQLQEQGKDTAGLLPESVISAMTEDELERACRELYARIDELETVSGCRFVEPSHWPEIMRESGTNHIPSTEGDTLPFGELFDRIYGAWLGRAAGCLLGKPVEGWPRELIRDLLERHHSYPLNHYFTIRHTPQVEEQWMLEEYERNAIEYCKAMPRDDDMDYTILALKTVETHGTDFDTSNVAEMWLMYLPPYMTYTAERAAYLNLCAGVSIPRTAVHLNPYREWIGAQIRTDLYGYINPGNPARAAEMAYRDAALSHTGNGIYGAMFAAAMIAASFTESDIEAVIRAGLAQIPVRSRLFEAISWVIDESRRESDWESAGDRLLERYGHYHRTHVINNAAIVILALLYGEGDLEKTISIAVMMGLDTDCNAATAGSVIGVLNGAVRMPDKWIAPLHDQIESYLAGEESPRISQLALRTVRLITQ